MSMSSDDEYEETGADWAVPATPATSLFGDFTGPVDEYVCAHNNAHPLPKSTRPVRCPLRGCLRANSHLAHCNSHRRRSRPKRSIWNGSERGVELLYFFPHT